MTSIININENNQNNKNDRNNIISTSLSEGKIVFLEDFLDEQKTVDNTPLFTISSPKIQKYNNPDSKISENTKNIKDIDIIIQNIKNKLNENNDAVYKPYDFFLPIQEEKSESDLDSNIINNNFSIVNTIKNIFYSKIFLTCFTISGICIYVYLYR